MSNVPQSRPIGAKEAGLCIHQLCLSVVEGINFQAFWPVLCLSCAGSLPDTGTGTYKMVRARGQGCGWVQTALAPLCILNTPIYYIVCTVYTIYKGILGFKF